MKQVTLDQRSTEWHDWRAQGIGGSEIPVLVAYAPQLLADAKAIGHAVADQADAILAQLSKIDLTSVYDSTPRKIWASKRGLAVPDVSNAHINRGVRFEDIVREMVEQRLGQEAIPLCAEHDSLPHFRVSFDGVLKDGRPLEIKCPSWRVFQKVKSSGIPAYYYPQVQYQAFIAGATETVFVAALIDEKNGVIADSYQENIPKDTGYVRAMLHVANFFWEAYVEGGREPPLVDKLDVAQRDDEAWQALAQAYRGAVEAAAFTKTLMDDAAKTVATAKKALADALGAYAKATGSGVTVTRFQTNGTVNYKSALFAMVPDLDETALEPYRGKGRVDVKVTLADAKSGESTEIEAE